MPLTGGEVGVVDQALEGLGGRLIAQLGDLFHQATGARLILAEAVGGTGALGVLRRLVRATFGFGLLFGVVLLLLFFFLLGLRGRSQPVDFGIDR